MAVERAPLSPSRPPPISAGASRWEGLAIDYETLPADGSLPCERWKMSGRAGNPPSRRLVWTRFFDGGAGGLPLASGPLTSDPLISDLLTSDLWPTEGAAPTWLRNGSPWL